MRELIEAESRTSDRLTILRKQAEREHRAAGFLTTAADTERRRLEWVQAELVKAGTERARSLGWTDVYTFTKALGERVVADVGSRHRESRWCGRRSSSRPGGTPTRAGSRASRWPSR